MDLDNNFCFIPETKSQFARDDPAFLVLLVISLCGKSSSFEPGFPIYQFLSFL